MALCQQLGIRSFELNGNELALVTPAVLADAAQVIAEQRASVPERLREAFEREQQHISMDAHRFLRKYNRNVASRIRGYLALGDRCEFAYPWPVVAILGICQVLTGLSKARTYGVLGQLASRISFRAFERFSDATADVLRRTNRGIFGDSAPTVVYALRCAELRADGQRELCDALLSGPLPCIMDEESRALASRLVDALSLADPTERFAALGALTLDHFAREQQIFSYHLGPARPAPRRSGLLSRLGAITSVPAPVVASGRVEFRPYPLPDGFDMRDHDARVREFGRAFVQPVVSTQSDYAAATAYVRERFQ